MQVLPSANKSNTDYYSVQSNGSSRNVSTTQGGGVAHSTVGLKSKGGVVLGGTAGGMGSQVRQSVGSRNTAVSNQTMIKSSNIIVTPVTPNKAGLQQLQQSESRATKNLLNQSVTTFGGASSPPPKDQHHQQTSRLSMAGCSQSNLHAGILSPQAAHPSTDAQISKTIINALMRPVASSSNNKAIMGSNEKTIGRFKATSQERLRQRQQSNDTAQVLYSNQRLNLDQRRTKISQRLIHQQLSRRTSNIGASPMTHCQLHNNKPPVLSPNKSLLQNKFAGPHKNQSNSSCYLPEGKETKTLQEVFQSKSVVLGATSEGPGQSSLSHHLGGNSNQKETPSSSIIQYSPKFYGGGQSTGGNFNILKLPGGVNQSHLAKKSTFQYSQTQFSKGSGSPQPSTFRHATTTSYSKLVTSRMSTGGGWPGTTTISQAFIIGEPLNSKRQGGKQVGPNSSLTYHQTSRIVHSKVQKSNANNSHYQHNHLGLSPDTFLKIDLNQITNTEVKKNSIVIASPVGDLPAKLDTGVNDDYSDQIMTVDLPFVLYNASGEEMQLNNLQGSERKKGPSHQGITQPMLSQLNSPSPKASQFFSKSPKISTVSKPANSSIIQSSNPNQTYFPSSNRHSLILPTSTLQAQPQQALQQTGALSSNQGTSRQPTTATFHQQTKSSLAKKQPPASIPSRIAQETQQSVVLKSKTQRMNYPSKSTYQKNFLVSKQPSIPSKDTKGKDQGPSPSSGQAIVSKPPVFEIVPQGPSTIVVELITPNTQQKQEIVQVIEIKSEEVKGEEVKLRIIEVDATRLVEESSTRGKVDNQLETRQPVLEELGGEQDISPPKEATHIRGDSVYFSAVNESPTQQKSPLKRLSLAQAQAVAAAQQTRQPFADFLAKHKDSLSSTVIQELLANPQSLVYFPGLSLQSKGVESKHLQESQESETTKPYFDDDDGYYRIRVGDHLLYRYEILKILGKGSFAQVVMCKDHHGVVERQVAIKITRNTELDHKFAQGEAKLLRYLMEHDPADQHNIVRLHEDFLFRDHHCFVFELLPQGDLFEHLKETGFQGLPLSLIRKYAQEILKSLVFLEQHHIIHCDLKPENILLLPQDRLKLVDFGSGSFRGEQMYTYVQSRFYRAPEVILRLMPPPTSYTEKVDIWSLGCILAELYTGEPLFPGNNEQEQLELIMEICGIPSNEFVDKCRKKEHYFDVDYSPFLIEEEEQGILRIPESKTLEQVVRCEDRHFIDFLKRCLELDPDLRFGAREASEHPWLKQQDVVATGTRAEWAQLSSLGDSSSISQDEVFKEGGEGLTAPDDMDGLYDLGGDRTRQEIRGSERQYLFIQESSQSNLQMMSVQSSQAAFINATNSIRGRRDEEQESGVRGTQFEESPIREQTFDKKKSLAQYTQSSQFVIKPRYIADVTSGNLGNLVEEIELQRKQVLIDLTENNNGMDNGSNFSSPKNEGGIQTRQEGSNGRDYLGGNIEEHKDDKGGHFQLLPIPSQKGAAYLHGSPFSQHSHERRDRSTRKKNHDQSPNITVPKSPPKSSLKVQQTPDRVGNATALSQKGIEVIGQYEIFREDEKQSLNKVSSPPRGAQQLPMDVRDSVTSGIATEANIPPVNTRDSRMVPQTSVNLLHNDGFQSAGNNGVGGIQTENQINKITITFYQKRGTNEGTGIPQQTQKQTPMASSGPAQPKKK